MKHFELYELVSKDTYEAMGDSAWSLFNPEALEALDNLREYFGVSVTVNTWKNGGSLQHRGYRTPQEAADLGSPNSQHRFGNAFDCDIQGISADDARKQICDNKDNPLLIKIQRLEDGVPWVHFDLKPVPNRIYLFKA
jgi:hypothetical protein